MSWAVTDSVGTQLWIDRTCRINLNYSGGPLCLAFCFGLSFCWTFQDIILTIWRATFKFRILEFWPLHFAPSSISRPEIVQLLKILSAAIISALVSFPTKHKSPAFIFQVLETNSKLSQTLCATPSPTLITLTQMTPCRNRWLDVFPFQWNGNA